MLLQPHQVLSVTVLCLTSCPVNDSSNLKRGAYIGEEDFIASPNKMARIEEPKRGIEPNWESVLLL